MTERVPPPQEQKKSDRLDAQHKSASRQNRNQKVSASASASRESRHVCKSAMVEARTAQPRQRAFVSFVESGTVERAVTTVESQLVPPEMRRAIDVSRVSAPWLCAKRRARPCVTQPANTGKTENWRELLKKAEEEKVKRVMGEEAFRHSQTIAQLNRQRELDEER